MMNGSALGQQPPLSARSSLGGEVQARRCIYDFTCQCGQVIVLQAELKEHYFKCEEMKKYYGDLFNLIVKYNHKNLTVPQKQSLNSVIDMFSNEIQNNIARIVGQPIQRAPSMPQPEQVMQQMM